MLAAALAAAGILAAVAAKASAGGTPWIRATAVPEQNLVRLEWGMEPASETASYNYMVYKREAGEAEFQSIPVKDRVKVLNIYPPVGESVTFINWRGQRFTLPKAASLKRWMEEPNAEHPRGYGMGLIDVDAVPIPEFNANPAGYLKNPDGSWKYDVIFNGSWDVNAGYDLNANSLPVVEQFIKSGRGYLTGHDTMFGDQATNVYTRRLRQYFRIKVGNPWGYWNAPPGEIDYKLPGRANYPSWIGSATVRIVRKGLLTNYPWRIGEPGAVLRVPFSHSTSQYVFGDVWLAYTNDSRVGYAGGSGWQFYEAGQAPSYVMNPGPPDDPDDPGGTNNFYLVTWSNTAMINTGHSNGEATPDEQKIIANTLFYLAQVTDGTSWDDHSAQDVAPPDPVAGIQAAPMPGGVEISWRRPKDNGNAYYYYVQAVSKATGDRLNSAVVGPISYATGVKGYAYAIDQNPDTDPGTAVNLTQERVAAALAPGKYYLHIRAVDNAGNVSEARHFPVEVGFVLQAALEPNPAMRGQKVNVYAALYALLGADVTVVVDAARPETEAALPEAVEEFRLALASGGVQPSVSLVKLPTWFSSAGNMRRSGYSYYEVGPSAKVKWKRFLSPAGFQDTTVLIGPDGVLYVGGMDGKVYAVRSADGAVLWVADTGGAIQTPGTIGPDGTLYFGNLAGKATAISPDGRIKWSRDLGA